MANDRKGDNERYRSAVDGKFVKERVAERNPREHVKETIKSPARPAGKKK